jgi:hypothetical protein
VFVQIDRLPAQPVAGSRCSRVFTCPERPVIVTLNLFRISGVTCGSHDWPRFPAEAGAKGPNWSSTGSPGSTGSSCPAALCYARSQPPSLPPPPRYQPKTVPLPLPISHNPAILPFPPFIPLPSPPPAIRCSIPLNSIHS